MSAAFRVALRLCSAALSEERSAVGLPKPHGNFSVDNSIDSAERCFDLVGQQTRTRCTYTEFHPHEDMSLQSRIHIEQDSEDADDIFEQTVVMLREARRFRGEPLYRPVKIEFGVDTVTDD